ncbi:MAG: RsmB/NOP family class I SAM-dependent RNA methyltransferase [Amylibacter sp.]
MTPAARYAVALDILDGFLNGEPAEKLLSNWARKNRYAGSKDRAGVRDIVFDCLRNLRSYGAQSGIDGGRGIAIGHCLALDIDPADMFSGVGYAPSALCEEENISIAQSSTPTMFETANLPDWICEIVQVDWETDFGQITQALGDRAPVDLRVNLAKASTGPAIASLALENIIVEPVVSVPTALRVVQNPRRVAGSTAFGQGLVELQDAASQAVIGMLDIRDGMQVLDYCAGGGGKTLAMAGLAIGANFDAWDISSARLAPLEERATRAGAKVRLLGDAPKHAIYDLVLVDAPCSGSGSWRRNPEEKWRLTQERLLELQTLQVEVLQAAAKNVLAGGTLAYATCSIFKRENGQQVDKFLARNPDFSLIKDHEFNIGEPSDGFYCSILKKQL